MNPTNKQLKRFWEWCGLYKDLATDGEHYWFKEEEIVSPTDDKGNPIIDLNNLFRYAIPKLGGLIDGLNVWEGTQGWVWEVIGQEYETLAEGQNKDPALALFWAIYKLIKKKE